MTALTSAQKQRQQSRDFQLRVVAAVLLLVFAWVLVEYTSLLYKSYQIELKKQWFIEENERITKSNGELAKKYEYYKTDYFFRKEAKRKLNKKEYGEKVAIITGGDEKIQYESDWEYRERVLEKWWDFLFGAVGPYGKRVSGE